MIQIVVFTKTLNATEAGMTNTNDSYVLIPQKIDASLLFPTQGPQLIRDFISGEDFQFRFESGREQRLYQLGRYCKENNVQCGDIISIERRTVDNNSRLFINAYRKHNIVFLQKHKTGFFIIRNDIGQSIFNRTHMFSFGGKIYELDIEFDCDVKKRKDSPTTLPLYNVQLSGQKNLSDVMSGNYIELDFHDNTIRIPDDIKLEIIRQ